MYNRLYRLHRAGKITAEQVYFYVLTGVITEEQYREITQANEEVSDASDN